MIENIKKKLGRLSSFSIFLYIVLFVARHTPYAARVIPVCIVLAALALIYTLYVVFLLLKKREGEKIDGKTKGQIIVSILTSVLVIGLGVLHYSQIEE